MPQRAARSSTRDSCLKALRLSVGGLVVRVHARRRTRRCIKALQLLVGRLVVRVHARVRTSRSRLPKAVEFHRSQWRNRRAPAPPQCAAQDADREAQDDHARQKYASSTRTKRLRRILRAVVRPVGIRKQPGPTRGLMHEVVDTGRVGKILDCGDEGLRHRLWQPGNRPRSDRGV
eukprot:CAMPEP_0117524824 /NCGR_PEP_ID=MMETSP0784-20121206/35450_1 /TAXON_ID=39447 /ORGANISM="" /LENGTH=174 /DNA_ID=CAMNT_0005320995 /DNA_START=138 /DNA_END=662 /DNA_ORIENTATION=-